MADRALQEIQDASFRANPDYELVLFDRLPPDQQDALQELRKDRDFYGILRPARAAGLSIKSVGQDTALLFLTLQTPGRLPGYVRARLGEQCNQVVTELVLDGVLEVEASGTFVSGPAAYGLICGGEPMAAEQGAIGRLSLEALKYAQALEITDSLKLSARLYFYNRQPVSPEWERRLPTLEAVREFLGIQAGGSNQSVLQRDWSRVSLSAPYDGWLMWKLRHAAEESERAGPLYKLYVSPMADSLREAFGATIDVFTRRRAPCFKVGNDVYGLLRPDKMVAYFPRFEPLQEAADELGRALAGCPAQGVPFTAAMAGDGLLSWGIDPPREQQTLGWQERESWRLWVTNRLATALLAAKANPMTGVEPWQFAMERLRLEGVDTEAWAPAETIWQHGPTGEE